MKFLTDGMLGKLTRWLRLLGYDIKYFHDADDEKLMKIATEEKRILLTRDYQLYRRASTHGVATFYVNGRTEAERLAELSSHFHIKLAIDVHNSRCPKCNAKLVSVSKEEIVDKIPESTSKFYRDFWRCPNCNQIYWQGSHWKKINNTLLQAKKIICSSKNAKPHDSP